MTSRLPCDVHDYFEIVCMRRSQIVVTTINNQKFSGVANTIRIIDNNEMLEIEMHDLVQHVHLIDIKKLQAVGNKVAQHNFELKI